MVTRISQTLLIAHLDGKMKQAFGVDIRNAARQLKREPPKHVIVLDASLRLDATAQMAYREVAGAEKNFR